ncbi:MAG TPA: SDR family oxidoreductase [Planctomycetota bacterium]|nr:SDR family oxidoreductase [Planctomycetota bacterium]
MHTLVTGGCGFLGTWMVKQLLAEGQTVTVFDLQRITKRWEMILSPEEIARIQFRSVKIEETQDVVAAVREIRPDAIIHLAGLQVPSCRENPVLGAKVNVIGTLNIFEAAKVEAVHFSPLGEERPGVRGFPRVVYASSAAVLGPDAEYPEGVVANDAAPKPTSHYGAYKLCNEYCAKAYWLTDKLPSVGLRPLTVYGPGRDFGMTSFPTRAIAAAILKRKFEIPFTGLTAYIHAREVADMFVRCSKNVAEDARVYSVGGDVTDTAGFLKTLERVLPGSSQFISAKGGDIPVTQRLDDAVLRRDYPGLLRIHLEQGLRETVEVFQRLAQVGKLEACL